MRYIPPEGCRGIVGFKGRQQPLSVVATPQSADVAWSGKYLAQLQGEQDRSSGCSKQIW